MKYFSVAELRQAFLKYFEENGHAYMSSASLVPYNDPTLLFVNAGMVPFKEYFLGFSKPKADRLTSVQRCVRAGGKHNDLDNVGYTARHHTFFEMLGNFSFGDYFKKEAIIFAWNFLTRVLEIPKEKLWISVFREDDESAAIWINDIGVDPNRLSRCGEKDNFWSMGATGPCGPCTEIFYDHGTEVAGGPPGSPDEDGDRYIEIWNIVFMQYDRDDAGNLTPLPKPCVDTGMGLERIAAVMQNVHNNYDIDLFKYLIANIASDLGVKDLANKSLRVLADHLRSICFLIADGIIPGNEGQSYVLRRVMRRAIRHGFALGATREFFYKFVPYLVQTMGDAYPELKERENFIADTILQEEKQFAVTLNNGMKLLEAFMPECNGVIPGEIAFKLYDTYGFPVDLTADVAREHGFAVDYKAFEAEMAKQKERSASVDGGFKSTNISFPEWLSSEFVGYDLDHINAEILFLYFPQSNESSCGSAGIVVLDKTPFYAEAGGQIGDKGIIKSVAGDLIFKVNDTQKQGDVYLHYGVVEHGSIKVGQQVIAQIDRDFRSAVVANHTATHLLHAALHNLLGDMVQQKGSLVASDKLRFDFNFNRSLTEAEIHSIEDWVNKAIFANTKVCIENCSMEQAKAKGAIALFGEKYGDAVRVLSIPGFSIELCGGTHVQRTGDIGCFKIILETSAAAGIRRLEAVTRWPALRLLQASQQELKTIAANLKCGLPQILERINIRLEELQQAKKQITELTNQLSTIKAGDALDNVEQVGPVKFLQMIFKDMDRNMLRMRVDELLQKIPDPAAVLLASINAENEAILVAKVSKSAEAYFTAVDLVRNVCDPLAGRGGGRADMAQGGASVDELSLQQAFDQLLAFLRKSVDKV
jgi:alanyl-tRNA synthetase